MLKTVTVAVVLVCALSACGSSDVEPSTKTVTVEQPSTSTPTPTPTPTEPATFTIRGTVKVLNEGYRKNQSCFPDDGYDDISEGTGVVVTNPGGRKIAVGSLGPGVSKRGEFGFGSDCVFNFAVVDVPEGGNIYTVEVGDRGELTYNRSELDKPLRLSLG